MAFDAEAALSRSLLETLHGVGRILARSTDAQQGAQQVLAALEEQAGLTRGLLCVRDAAADELVARCSQGLDIEDLAGLRYRRGEGVLGRVLQDARPLALPAIAGDPRFLNRLGAYERRLPFIAVPIHAGGQLQGVLALQPNRLDDGLLALRTRFVEIVADLLGPSLLPPASPAGAPTPVAPLTAEPPVRRSPRQPNGLDNIVGHSAGMRRIFEQIRMVSKWNTTVLIRGETGTGKELIANAIHSNSPRAPGPYVRLNCASLPENLLESELFGHEKGAFTGAIAARKGRFEMAHGGTIFLDEIGEISPAFQAKLLRVLQEGELERVGGGHTVSVDVRVIAATHRDLEQAVDDGRFREDLYFRLNVMPIRLPALRERLEDVPEIARHLIGRIARAQGRALHLGEAALNLLVHYNWPGNVRELENCLERAAVMSENGEIDSAQIRIDRQRTSAPGAGGGTAHAPKIDLADPNIDERTRVITALEQAGWVQAKAARLLNMTPRQIAYRILTLDIEVKQF